MQKTIFRAFIAIFAVKILLTLNIHGPNLYPDEGCVILQAQSLGSNFLYRNCEELTKLPAGGIMPVYFSLLSPIYFFLKGKAAYHAILIFNALISALLIFPLSGIFKKFLTSNAAIILSSLFIIFSPEIQTYESVVKSDLLFSAINIWFLATYIKALETKSIKTKLLAALLAILSALTRPFGFITAIAFTISELVLSKSKKIPVIITIISLALSVAIIWIFLPGVWPGLIEKTASLQEPQNLKLILVAIKNQINSFSVATFMIPIIIFATYFKSLGKIKYFLLSYILMNFAISAQHIFGYYLAEKELDLLTRYISPSTIFILIFATIFVQTKKPEFNKKTFFTAIILLIPILFFKHANATINVNTTLQAFFNITNESFKSGFFVSTMFIPTIFLLIILFLFKKFKILIPAICVLLLSTTTGTLSETYARSAYEYSYSDWKLFENSENNILFLYIGDISSRTYLKTLMFTNNKATITSFPSNLNEYDYLITNVPEEDLATNKALGPYKIGETYHFESIYHLKKPIPTPATN